MEFNEGRLKKYAEDNDYCLEKLKSKPEGFWSLSLEHYTEYFIDIYKKGDDIWYLNRGMGRDSLYLVRDDELIKERHNV